MLDQELRYFEARAAHARTMSQAAVDPGIKAIHLEFADRYARLAQDRLDSIGHGGLVAAASTREKRSSIA